MKLETFFEKFEMFADAPNAVAKMRELVLTLAVQGKLVPQDPNDEPAEKILSRIAATKLRLQKNGDIVKEKPVEPLQPDSLPFDTPDSWKWAKLAELTELITKGSSPKWQGIAYVSESEGILFITSENVGNYVLRKLDDLKYVSKGFNEIEPRSILKRGDILMNLVGASIGRTAVYDLHGGANINQAVALIRLVRETDGVCPRFLLHYLNSPSAIDYMLSSRVVNAQPNISLTDAREFAIPLPPLAEQKRIVAKVDELMALCDRLEAQQQEREEKHKALSRASLARFADAPTPTNLQFIFHPSYTIAPADLRKSILTLAVQGKLVPQDPNDEPAEKILSRIAATKLRLQKNGDIVKEKPVEPLQPDSLPFDTPDSWKWAKLAELTELITKGSSPKWQGIAYVSESEGILFITSENVGNYVLRKLDDLKYVSKGFNEIEPRSILKRGDILMNLVGASIGRTAVYDLHGGANINQAVALIRLVRETDGVCPRFLLHYLNSPSAIDYMLSSRVVNAQPNISLTDAREFAIPLPPLAEQKRIVAKVEQLMALVDALETQLAASRATAANLLAAIVAELTGTPNTGKVSAPTNTNTGTGRRGRPPKS